MKCLIIYGTETNTSERAAKNLQSALSKAFPSDELVGPVGGNKSTDFADIATYDAVVVATSSYGDGDAPSNYDKVSFCIPSGE